MSEQDSIGITNNRDQETLNNDSSSAAIGKRKYSRNGCTECKKRRMKCDETKPKCWQCTRLNRDCIYILNRKNKTRRPKGKSSPTSNGSLENGGVVKTALNGVHNDHVGVGQVPLMDEFTFSTSDANSLFNDLNDIVNFRLEEALTPNLKTYIEESSNTFNTDFLNNTGVPITANNEIIINHPLSSIDLGEPHNGYLRRFYNGFCRLLCPFVPNHNQNPVRDVLLQYAKSETYLMYAVLACGAKSSHRDTLTIQDDQAYCTYLSSCLNILSENFSDDNSMITGNVEAMLLTILLLTSDCASSKNLIWRAHLKGAKELLKKTTIQSDILNFCRNWLIAYELLAGIANPFGGIFQKDENELNEFLTNDEVYISSLKKLNMLDIHGFNYFDGHVLELDLIYRDIINILNKIRNYKRLNMNKSHLDSSITPQIVNLDEITNLIVRLDRIEKISVISSTGIIPETNPNHPSQNKIEEGFDCIDTLIIDETTSITISWFDVSHQAHTIAAKLTLLVKVLEMPKTSILVQDLVKKGLSYLRFLNYMKNYENPCMTHLHIMIDLLGRCLVNEDDMKLTKNYLQILHGMGLASAGHNLKKLERIWNDDHSSGAEEDVLTW